MNSRPQSQKTSTAATPSVSASPAEDSIDGLPRFRGSSRDAAQTNTGGELDTTEVRRWRGTGCSVDGGKLDHEIAALEEKVERLISERARKDRTND